MKSTTKLATFITTGILLGFTSAVTGLSLPAGDTAPQVTVASQTTPAASDAIETTIEARGTYEVVVIPKPKVPEVDASMIASSDVRAFVTKTDWDVQWPFPVGVHISSGFGHRLAPCEGCPSDHRGTDFAIGENTPVQPIAKGKVLAVGWDGGYGYRVMLEHIIDGKKIVSIYGHLFDKSSPLQKGDIVETGDLLGRVGSTGKSTGNHLHLEILINNVKVDPEKWLLDHAGKATTSDVDEADSKN